MAKEFSKAFYNSKSWKSCRSAYISKRIMIDGGMCEKCQEKPGEELHHKIFLRPENITDVTVTLNSENLILLCKDCHFKEHRQAIIQGFQKRKKRKVLINGMYFENGMPTPQKIYIVYGAPASGKTSYVKKHMKVGDLIVDLDYLMHAISYTDRNEDSNNLLNIVFKIRECIYDAIISKEVDAERIWIISGLPKKKEREQLKEQMQAILVPILKTKQECYENAKKDNRDMYLQKIIIDKWFEEYVP